MRITYMIGNGFDIALGLKTKYTDFYEYLQKDFNYEKNIKNDILENISKNIELWSDLELGLGDYTKYIGDDQEKLEKFFDDKFSIEIKIKEYLKLEQEKINWGNEQTINNIKDKFFYYVSVFFNLLKSTDKDDILKIISGQNCQYSIISFNYTNVIQKCMLLTRQKPIELFYLHGSLEKDNVILGVNDSEQINNKLFKEHEDMLLSMCKLETNKYLGEYATNKAEKILDESSIVCIFEMSIGDTDKYWWNKIASNISKGIIEMLIIFHYEDNLDMSNNIKVSRTERKVKDQLFQYLANENKVKFDFKSKIKVLCNSDMFRFNLVYNDASELEVLLGETVNM